MRHTFSYDLELFVSPFTDQIFECLLGLIFYRFWVPRNKQMHSNPTAMSKKYKHKSSLILKHTIVSHLHPPPFIETK